MDRLSRALVVAWLMLLLLTGCPPDDVASDGDTAETAETGDPGSDAVDPLGGDGSVPAGSPAPEDRWVAPSTLGNGLVHDTRSNVDSSIHVASFTAAELAAGVDWSSFVVSNNAMQARGFRPAQVDAAVELTANLEILDDTLYISDDDANYLGGVPLAAGGWWADGEALGRLIRAISRTSELFSLVTVNWLWHPGFWNFQGSPAPPWAYVHGWYVRGNWVAWMGGRRRSGRRNHA